MQVGSTEAGRKVRTLLQDSRQQVVLAYTSPVAGEVETSHGPWPDPGGSTKGSVRWQKAAGLRVSDQGGAGKAAALTTAQGQEAAGGAACSGVSGEEIRSSVLDLSAIASHWASQWPLAWLLCLEAYPSSGCQRVLHKMKKRVPSPA